MHDDDFPKAQLLRKSIFIDSGVASAVNRKRGWVIEEGLPYIDFPACLAEALVLCLFA